MEARIYAICVIIVSILVMLSAFGPRDSEKKFWKAIFKIRAGIDLCSRWFFNVCGVITLVIVFYYLVLKGLIGI